MKEMLKKFFSGLDSGSPDQVQNKQKLIKMVGVGAIGAVMAVFVFSGNDVQKTAEKPEELKIYTDEDAAQSGYVGKVAPQVTSMIEQSKLLSDENQEMKDKLKKMEENLEALRAGGGTMTQDPSSGFPPPPDSKKGQEAAQMLGLVPGSVPTPPPEAVNPKRIIQKSDEIKDSLVFDSVKKDEGSGKNTEPVGKLKSGINAKKPFLPTGAITKARLLNGIYAPTMTKAKSNPLPVLMRMVDLSIIPNRKKFNIKECFILGEGFGELSSERVHIRLTDISCVTKQNKIIDMEVKGFVAGEDGATGISGKVVSKQGAMLGRTILAGFLQGVGQSMSTANQSIMQSTLGTTTATTDLSPEAVAKSGAFAGGAKAAEKLADFYLKMADSIEPVIEVSGGRLVDVTITKGVELRTRDEIESEKKANSQGEQQAQDTAPMTPSISNNNTQK